MIYKQIKKGKEREACPGLLLFRHSGFRALALHSDTLVATMAAGRDTGFGDTCVVLHKVAPPHLSGQTSPFRTFYIGMLPWPLV